MATPTDPTATTLVTEALNKAGITTPSATELTRATKWLQEILNDLWQRTAATGNSRLQSLETEGLSVSVKGVNFMSLPEDFDEEVSILILDGNYRGTAQAGAALTVTLASAETVTAVTAIGKWIVITGGTGSGQYRRIVDYSATTKIATVDSAWATNPDLTSTYLVVDKTPYKLDEDNIGVLDESSLSAALGRPSYFAKYNRKLYFDRPFDIATYGVLYRYFMYVTQVDLTEGSTTRFTRILRNWRAVLDAGMFWKAMLDKDDTRQITAKAEYERLANGLVVKDIAYGGEFAGFSV